MSAPPAAAVTVPEPAAEPPVATEGAQLALKVRTLDQKTYPITVCAAASVPQLKELVAVETGVTLARQRLIYRGRVLKNDQSLAAYSLEDGHVLHLVVRAAPPPADAAGAASATPAPDPNAVQGIPRAGGRIPTAYQYTAEDINEIDALGARIDEFERSSLRSRARSRQRRGVRSAPPPPRDNDEPDPTMGRPGRGGLPGRMLMGATISVPEGAEVTMPFLSSMIANLVTQASEGGVGVEGGATTTTTDGRRHVTFSSESLAAGTAAEREAAMARALRRHHRNRDGSGRQRHGRRPSSFSYRDERQAAFRARTRLRLDSVGATLDDSSLEFPAELTALPQEDTNVAMVEFQQQVEMLLTLVQRFGPRVRLLPAALAQRDRMNVARGDTVANEPAGSTATPSTEPVAEFMTTSAGSTETVSSRHVIRAIEALETIGESADLLARMARHAFVRQSVQLGEPLSRRLSAYTSGTTAGDRIQATLDAFGQGRAGNADATVGDRMQATHDARQGSTRAARLSTRSATNSRPHFRMARVGATNLLGHRGAAAASTVFEGAGSTLNFPVDLTDSASGAVPPAGAAPSARNPQPGTRTQPTDAAPNVNGSLPPAGAHISIGLPLMSSVVFPFSLAAGFGGSHATTTWNLADFVSRLSSELPISTLYGVLAGDATHLHHIFAHIGFAMFSGVDVPRVTRPSIRTWAQDLVGELRRLLHIHVLPADVLDQVAGHVERRSALGDELLRAVEPFIPDLVDFLVRATSASRAAAFGTSSATFLHTMAQQVVHRVGVYARGDSTESEDDSAERLKRLLRGLLVWFGIHEHMASFFVDSLLCWTGDESASRRGRTRQRDAGTNVDTTDSPATKRRRE